VIQKRKIGLKQITAFFFMLVLFAVTTIQVSHIHPSGLTLLGTNKAIEFSACEKLTLAGSCFICDYQLTKDADNRYATYLINRTSVLHITAAASYTFTLQSIYPVFETRGPPSI
jgi:hypothetical protein